jgi:glycosyltransferase involved in cell wall biosynthesis
VRVVLVGRYRVPYPYSRHTLDHQVLRAWAAGMERLDVIVQATAGQERTWVDGNLTVHYAPATVLHRSGPAFVAWAARRIAALHRRAALDVIDGSDLWGGLTGVLLRRSLGVKVLAQLQGEFLPPSRFSHPLPQRLALHALARLVCRRADLVRCLYGGAAAQVEALGVPGERVAVVPSRCDPARFDPAAFPRRIPGGQRLVCAGNLIRGKGVAVLLDALAALAPHHAELRLTLVGDGPEARRLRRRAVRLGVADRVRFLGRRPHQDLPALLHEADVFVLPSLSEATPRVVLEAMAMGLPVVTTRVGGLPEMVVDGRTGLLVDPADAQELAAAIGRTLANPVWAVRAGVLGRRRVLACYTTEQHVRAMIALRRRLAGPRATHPTGDLAGTLQVHQAAP